MLWPTTLPSSIFRVQVKKQEGRRLSETLGRTPLADPATATAHVRRRKCPRGCFALPPVLMVLWSAQGFFSTSRAATDYLMFVLSCLLYFLMLNETCGPCYDEWHLRTFVMLNDIDFDVFDMCGLWMDNLCWWKYIFLWKNEKRWVNFCPWSE